MNRTAIAWCDLTNNVVRGCAPVSPGCAHCYAAGIAYRFSGAGLAYEGLARRQANGRHPAWTGEVRLAPERLLAPLRLRRGSRIFVNSQSDLWWDRVPDEVIGAHLAVAYLAPGHRFLSLTKRAQRLAGWLDRWGGADPVASAGWALAELLASSPASEAGRSVGALGARIRDALDASPHRLRWPPPNWLQGVSVETPSQLRRVDALRRAGFACPWVSAEPLLAPIAFEPLVMGGGGCRCDACEPADRPCWACAAFNEAPRIEWIVAGGESGPRARPVRLEWLEEILRLPCDVFLKQLGARIEASRALDLTPGANADPDRWPEELRRQEVPSAAIPEEGSGVTVPRRWPW